jgi:hypothetical protein
MQKSEFVQECPLSTRGWKQRHGAARIYLHTCSADSNAMRPLTVGNRQHAYCMYPLYSLPHATHPLVDSFLPRPLLGTHTGRKATHFGPEPSQQRSLERVQNHALLEDPTLSDEDPNPKPRMQPRTAKRQHLQKNTCSTVLPRREGFEPWRRRSPQRHPTQGALPQWVLGEGCRSSRLAPG